MAAPAIPPIRLGLHQRRHGDHTASCPEIPVPPEPDDMRPRGTEDVLAGSESERCNSDATTHTTVLRGNDNGYRAELVADPVRFGVRRVGSVAQGVVNAMVVRRALDSAGRADVLAPDPVPGAVPVPLRRSRDSTGLPGQRISSSASFAA